MTTDASTVNLAAPARRGRRALFAAAAACGLAAAVGAALQLGWNVASSPTTAANEAAAGATELELGREVCGECCETRIWGAIGSLPGVRDVVAHPGSSKIVVHHDGHVGAADQLLAGLRRVEYPEARLLGAAADVEGRVWIRPVAPMR
jgi:hypothetical protein